LAIDNKKMDDKLAAEEARRAAQHEAVKAQVEGEVQSEISERAATKTTATSHNESTLSLVTFARAQ